MIPRSLVMATCLCFGDAGLGYLALIGEGEGGVGEACQRGESGVV